jgi:hypothetical protein
VAFDEAPASASSEPIMACSETCECCFPSRCDSCNFIEETELYCKFGCGGGTFWELLSQCFGC